jgi:hypothetical protein
MNEIHYGRKRSGIKKEIEAKLKDWFATIDDETLRKKVEKNTIVTGGCIASMLLGEKINDFDVYFRDQATTVAVAEYYVAKFNKNKVEVAEGVTHYEPKVQTATITNIKGEAEDRVLIYMKSAGVAAEEQVEYDYFEMQATDDKLNAFVESLNEAENDTKEKYRPVFLSQNAITLSHKLQIVIRFFGEPTEIHRNYDFQHAMCYYDSGSGEMVLPAEALECMLSRTLVYKGSLYPICSIFRAKKFIERGWRISAGQLLKIMWQISELDLKNMETLREQLTGVDAMYFYQLMEAVKNLDTSKIDATYIATIIDRIFGE